MFKDYPYIVVGIAMSFMCFTLWLVLKYTKPLIAEHKIMFLMVYITVVIVNSWVIDNLLAFKLDLLDAEENKTILQIMFGIVNFGLGYYSATNKSEKKDDIPPPEK
jgi:uncharacterized membrane protein YphA (DoxX/SURF4 family)